MAKIVLSVLVCIALCVSSAHGAVRGAGEKAVASANGAMKGVKLGSLRNKFEGFGVGLKQQVFADINIAFAKESIQKLVNEKTDEVKTAVANLEIAGFDKATFVQSFKEGVVADVNKQVELVMKTVDQTIAQFKTGSYREEVLASTGLTDTEDLVESLKKQVYESVDAAVGGTAFIEGLKTAAYAAADEAVTEAKASVAQFNSEELIQKVKDMVQKQTGFGSK